ncbi:MAG: hypothetical protein QM526_00900 [Alphaproteobacteria bacterium]|nr:hypothetical protein [Alphaproteobacteria bacterium]
MADEKKEKSDKPAKVETPTPSFIESWIEQYETPPTFAVFLFMAVFISATVISSFMGTCSQTRPHSPEDVALQSGAIVVSSRAIPIDKGKFGTMFVSPNVCGVVLFVHPNGKEAWVRFFEKEKPSGVKSLEDIRAFFDQDIIRTYGYFYTPPNIKRVSLEGQVYLIDTHVITNYARIFVYWTYILVFLFIPLILLFMYKVIIERDELKITYKKHTERIQRRIRLVRNKVLYDTLRSESVIAFKDALTPLDVAVATRGLLSLQLILEKTLILLAEYEGDVLEEMVLIAEKEKKKLYRHEDIKAILAYTNVLRHSEVSEPVRFEEILTHTKNLKELLFYFGLIDSKK